MLRITEFEILILNWIRGNLSCEFLDVTMKFITSLCNNGIFFTCVAVICILFKKTRVFGCTFSIAMSLQYFIVCGILKPLFERPRPYIYNDGISIIVASLNSYSFPSGHTALAFAFAFSLLVYGKKGFIPGLIFAILMGFSRMYLYVHYPSDVLIGAIIGALCGYVPYLIVSKFNLNREKNKNLDV